MIDRSGSRPRSSSPRLSAIFSLNRSDRRQRVTVPFAEKKKRSVLEFRTLPICHYMLRSSSNRFPPTFSSPLILRPRMFFFSFLFFSFQVTRPCSSANLPDASIHGASHRKAPVILNRLVLSSLNNFPSPFFQPRSSVLPLPLKFLLYL